VLCENKLMLCETLLNKHNKGVKKMKATFTLAPNGCPVGNEISREGAVELAGETINAVLGNLTDCATIELDDGNWIIVSKEN